MTLLPWESYVASCETSFKAKFLTAHNGNDADFNTGPLGAGRLLRLVTWLTNISGILQQET
jgi:hypothetical protein